MDGRIRGRVHGGVRRPGKHETPDHHDERIELDGLELHRDDNPDDNSDDDPVDVSFEQRLEQLVAELPVAVDEHFGLQ